MTFTVDKYWLNNFKEIAPTSKVYQKLSNLMNSIVKGNDEVILSPIADREGWTNIQDEWIQFYDSIDKSNWPDVLIDMELSQQEKLGPRSIAKPWSEIRDTLYEYFEPPSGKLVCDESVLSPFKTRGLGVLRPLSTDSTLKKIKKSTSSGLPFYTSKSEALESTLNDAFGSFSEFWPAIMFERTQEQGKTRIVWGISLGQVLKEAPFFFPLLDQMSKSPWLSALQGPDAVDAAMDRKIKYAISNDLVIVTLDFSRFDTTVKGSLLDCSWDVVRSFFQPSYRDIIDKIEYEFRNVGIVCPDGMVSGEHGYHLAQCLLTLLTVSLMQSLYLLQDLLILICLRY